MNAFDHWNLLLLREYFAPGQQGEAVFFDTTPDRLDELGPALGGSKGLLAAARQGPSWNCGGSLHERVSTLIAQRSQAWRRPPGYLIPGRLDDRYGAATGPQSAPAYLPYLAALVAIWAIDENADGIYGSLQEAFGLPPNWKSSKMAEVSTAWTDLASWTTATGGRYGTFRVRQLGEQRYVGQLRAQTVLRERDHERLAGLFEACGLQPRSEPTQDQLNALLAAASETHGISVGLRRAANSPDFRDFLCELFRTALLDWDGVQEETEGRGAAGALEARFGLSLSDSDGLPWEPMLAIPGVGDGWDGAPRVLRVAGRDATLQFEQGRGQVCRDPLLVGSLAEGEPWNCTLVEGQKVREVANPRRLLWVLAGERGPTGRIEAWEAPLPTYGDAYLLASRSGAAGLDAYLLREQPQHVEVPVDGLPDGWRMVYLSSQALTDGQRVLPDGKPPHRRLHAIRFERGISIRRGGKRRFLAYDLPSVVLDAPAAAALYCSGETLEGTRLDNVPLLPAPESPGQDPAGPVIGHVGVRRFVLPDAVEAGGRFRLSARLDGLEVASATMLVATSDGATRLVHGECSLDPAGRVQQGTKGLRGSLDSGLLRENGSDVPLFHGRVEELGTGAGLAGLQSSPGARFLDALAGGGSMAWGRARDLAARLMASARSPVQPRKLIDDLWCRGHLELERNARGHYVRVHAVPPAVHPLAVSVDGRRLHGILGTLTLAHWKDLAKGQSLGVDVLVDESVPFLPVARLLDTTTGTIEEVFGAGGPLALVPFQGLAIANWSADTRAMLAELEACRFEQPPERSSELRQLNVRTGVFSPTDQIRSIRQGEPQFLVYQMLDTRTDAHRLYMVAMPNGFSFAWAARWARWLALEAFCEFLKSRLPDFPDLSQLPLPYDERSGTLWLPEALRLPIVLERAAVLCNGAPPSRFEMVGGEEEDGRLILRFARSGVGATRVSMVYEGYASGPWLCYRHVPKAVIDAITN